MMGSETFIMVALRWTENRTSSALARAICSARKAEHRPGGELLNICDARCSAHIVDVVQYNLNNLSQGQGGDGQIVTAQPQRGYSDQEAQEPGSHSAQKQSCKQRQGVRQDRCTNHGDIGTDGHKACMPQGELSGKTVNEVKAHRQDNVDADQVKINLIEAAQEATGYQYLHHSEDDGQENDVNDCKLPVSLSLWHRLHLHFLSGIFTEDTGRFDEQD
jgi:hypothetical protein